jgi:AcrR family transcriptional regulator
MTHSGYHSPRRQEAAAATRRAILDAARRLFLERGYPATTIQDIAAAAQVAPATVYTSVGGKPRLLAELVESAAADPQLQDRSDQANATEDPENMVRIAASASRYSNEVSADLFELMHTMAPHDATVAQAARKAHHDFRYALRHVAERLHQLTALGVTTDQAVDILDYFLSYSSWRRLTTDLGWSPADAEKWLGDRVIEALVHAPGRSGRQRDRAASPRP